MVASRLSHMAFPDVGYNEGVRQEINPVTTSLNNEYLVNIFLVLLILSTLLELGG